MNIINKLPQDIVRYIIPFTYTLQPQCLLEDIRDYSHSLNKLYSVSYAQDHTGFFGRARLLNSLWVFSNYCCGNYYQIWKRMFGIKHKPEIWISNWYAIQPHNYQIRCLWGMFTKDERYSYFIHFKN